MKTMKNIVIKSIVFVGLLVTVLGTILDPLITSDPLTFAGVFMLVPFLPLYIILAAALGTAFIYSKNATLANVGYGLMAFGGAIGIAMLIWFDSFSLIVIPVGLIIMFVGALLKAILAIISFFGFEKAGSRQPSSSDVADALLKFKDLEKDGVLSEEEFAALKEKLIASDEKAKPTIDDLKKWKKLLDQNVITEEEFAELKKKLFAE